MSEWTAAFISDLPDSAFACIDAGGEKDDEGKTVPRSLRHYPHHNAEGAIDLPHLRNALSRLGQDDTTSCGASHLRNHAQQEGIGKTMTGMEHKSVPFADFKMDVSSGEFSGYASIFGNVDAGNDIVVRGAYAKALPAFMRDGFISWSHDWGTPIAMPTEAHEDEKGLFLAGRFHSTAEAQAARTIAAERAANGKRTGLSIGYDIEDWSLDKAGRRLLKIINPLHEVGFVMVPMNRESNLTAVKDLRGSSPESGDGLAGAVARFLGDADTLVAQFSKMADLREKEGRSLSATNRQRFLELMEAHNRVGEAFRAFLAEIDPDKSAHALAILREALRRNGVKFD